METDKTVSIKERRAADSLAGTGDGFPDMALTTKDLTCDVLVVGSGAAGAMAAIKAQLAGADVLVATKGPYPSGNSTKALAGYAAAFGHSDQRDTPDIHFGDVVRNGVGLCNQKLVKVWTRAICDLTEEMRGWGLDVIRQDGKYVQVPWEGHMYPRMVNHNRVTGKYVMKCLGEKSAALGIRSLPHTVVGGLFRDEDAISGAWGFDYRNLQYVVIRAKSVILTTGGIGAMYPVGDNVSTATGEGFALAFDAGAEMTGMEFSHFLPTVVSPKPLVARFAYIPFVNGLINQSEAKLYNGRNERFLARRFPETAEKRIKAEDLVRYMGEEIFAGRGGKNGGIYLDLADVPATFESDPTYARVWQLAARAGIDLRKERMELIPYPHDHVGGIRIDELGRTNVPGLYAAGESTGSSHGASRFGGSALSDALVFGAIAAQDAAVYAAAMDAAPRVTKADVTALAETI